jgi:hypothetical protein
VFRADILTNQVVSAVVVKGCEGAPGPEPQSWRVEYLALEAFRIPEAEGLKVLAGERSVADITWQRAGITDIASVAFPRADVPLDILR